MAELQIGSCLQDDGRRTGVAPVDLVLWKWAAGAGDLGQMTDRIAIAQHWLDGQSLADVAIDESRAIIVPVIIDRHAIHTDDLVSAIKQTPDYPTANAPAAASYRNS
jgi:hypothetical protein